MNAPGILHEDADILVVDKPVGLVVHAGAGTLPGTTLVDWLLEYCGVGLRDAAVDEAAAALRPGLVHRLDKGTSGVLAVAKNRATLIALREQFSAHTIDRRYFALCRGVPSSAQGRIRGRMGRSPGGSAAARKRMAMLAEGGRLSETRYRVLATLAGGAAALIEAAPVTGRTHQVRLHFAAMGNGLLGDPVYGGGVRCLARLGIGDAAVVRPLLHAASLGFIHPKDGSAVRFRADPPADFCAVLTALGGSVADVAQG